MLNLLEKKDAAWNWVAKDPNPLRIAGRGDGTTMSTGVSITPSAWDVRNRDGRIAFHLCMSKQLDRKGGDMDDKVDDISSNTNRRSPQD